MLLLKRRISHTHIVGSQAFSWQGGGLDPGFCMINGPVPGEDLEKTIKESRAFIHICNSFLMGD